MTPSGIFRFKTIIANAYFVGTPESWLLVDAVVPGNEKRIASVAREHFGDTPPRAIVLTHGHYDHAGSALALSASWNVPVYAHPLELRFLTTDDYPPPDLTVGGPMVTFAKLFAKSTGFRLGDRVRPLPADYSIPGLKEWHWMHTPGHTPGHISLFREADRSLIAGDGLTTMDLDSWSGLIFQKPGFFRPPAPFTMEMSRALETMRGLLALRPAWTGAGHGEPYSA